MKNKTNPKDYSQLLDKVKKVTTQKQLDLSSDEDLSIGIMNLISIEEHLHFTAQKTGKNSYLDLLREVRDMRKSLLKEIIKDYEGEVWCISKHLLAAAMRLMEVGTKQLGQGKKEKAEDLFKKSYQLYSLFWAINLSRMQPKDLPTHQSDQKEIVLTDDANPQKKSRLSLFDQAGRLVQKLIDCCIE